MFNPPTLADLRFTEDTEDALRNNPYLGRKLASLARDLHEARAVARAEQSRRLDYYVDRDGGYKEGTASFMAASKRLLEDETTPAGVLLLAGRNLLGPGMAAFAPDTIRIEFEEREKVKLPAVNYDKLFAAITLKEAPLFYYEVLTFQNTVLAFNDVLSDPEVLAEARPFQIAWGVYEAELILQEDMQFSPEFDYEPISYVAAVLHRAGFIVAPALLEFAQHELSKLNKKTELKEEKVRDAWAKLDKATLTSRTFSEDPLDVQLAKLATVQVYVSERADRYKKALADVRAA